MKTKHWIGTTLFVGVLAAAGTAALQQEKKQEKAAVPAAAKDDSMAAMMAYGTPGPAHKVLESKIGKWTAKGKFYMPGSPEPMTNEFQSEAKWIMNGLFVQETVTGEWMGQPFEGTSITGYDNIKKKYVQTWMDNGSSGIMYAEGTYDAAAKTFTFTGEGPEMATMAKYVKTRGVDKMIDADHGMAQGYEIGADGKERLSMEIGYTRAK